VEDQSQRQADHLELECRVVVVVYGVGGEH
jgi:hypothetical protein